MNTAKEWKNVGRIVWATGGVVAINEPGPNVKVTAGLGGHAIFNLSITSFPDLFSDLVRQRFKIVGVSFVSTPEELQGLRPPEFRAWSTANGWFMWNVIQSWRQITHAAAKANQMPLMSIASRLAMGLRYSEMRLRDLATAYSSQLRAYLCTSTAKEYAQFKDFNSFEVFKSIHALFWELAVLRDTLAEFASVFCYSLSGIRTMRGLCKELTSKPSRDALAEEMLRATDKKSGGWLATFSDYRNFFTHIAPMEAASNLAFAIQDMTKFSEGSAPQIFYPLPPNIGELTQKMSAGAFYPSFAELQAEVQRKHDRVTEPDALEYMHFCLERFTEMARILIAHSPLAPRPIALTPEDIIGAVQVR
jgi:hypothetical protein